MNGVHSSFAQTLGPDLIRIQIRAQLAELKDHLAEWRAQGPIAKCLHIWHKEFSKCLRHPNPQEIAHQFVNRLPEILKVDPRPAQAFETARQFMARKLRDPKSLFFIAEEGEGKSLPRRIPETFEGNNTDLLAQELLRRGILTEELLFIDNGSGQIDSARIRNKMAGATPREAAILLKNWSRDGHCAFNGFALGFCDACLSGKIQLTTRQLARLQRKLKLVDKSQECLVAWISSRTLDQRQRKLQSIFRGIAVDYILKNEKEIYQQVYEQQLYGAYSDPDDDTFRAHPHIAQKFREPHLSLEELSEWWHAEGKEPYFAHMRKSGWGGEVEMDALARYFDIRIGGKALYGFNEEQIRRFLDLNIGERIGNAFQLHRFEALEELLEKIEPLAPEVQELVERMMKELETEEDDLEEMLLIEAILKEKTQRKDSGKEALQNLENDLKQRLAAQRQGWRVQEDQFEKEVEKTNKAAEGLRSYVEEAEQLKNAALHMHKKAQKKGNDLSQLNKRITQVDISVSALKQGNSEVRTSLNHVDREIDEQKNWIKQALQAVLIVAVNFALQEILPGCTILPPT